MHLICGAIMFALVRNQFAHMCIWLKLFESIRLCLQLFAPCVSCIAYLLHQVLVPSMLHQPSTWYHLLGTFYLCQVLGNRFLLPSTCIRHLVPSAPCCVLGSKCLLSLAKSNQPYSRHKRPLSSCKCKQMGAHAVCNMAHGVSSY